MNLLLDTHIALWAIGDNPKLSDKARKLITDSDNTILLFNLRLILITSFL